MSLLAPPLSLYIHIPWCVRKCPYCDFNSHAREGALPVDDYVRALLADLGVEPEDTVHPETVALLEQLTGSLPRHGRMGA